MMDLNTLDYARLDVPEVLLRLFHPRPELSLRGAGPAARDLLIPVADNVVVGARFHPAAATAPTILFSTATARSWLIMTNWPPSTGARASTFCRWITGVMAGPPAPRR